ncbi:NAD-dependent epimerase/dehydratase family protein [Luteimonas suaedae]|uniref:NAD-dependent epimerase/dehydratase family protein n=1 Tax=Luteimonas suaedae TaxID=2605430 RepID=UPI0011ED8636|nr:NAD-dependent epimerase/dehydratase family protein [Luteimonas suaedae]
MSAESHRRLADIGLIEWLRIGDVDRVDQLLEDMRMLGVRRLRTQFSWADWHAPDGAEWYRWLLPRLAAECELLPCFSYTPPSLGIEPRTASPPRDSRAFADFLDQMIGRFGRHFEWVELWNEPNNLNDWDWHLDHDWQIFSSMIGQAAHWARKLGKKTLLGGMCPTDPNWLAMMAQRGVLRHIDAVGIHGFPGTWEFHGRGWSDVVREIRRVLQTNGASSEIWLTEVGYSTWRHDEIEQLRQLRATLEAPVERIYWYGAYDLHDSRSHQDGFHEDERHYHFGLRDEHGRAKLAFRIWEAGGFDAIDALVRLHSDTGVGLSRAPRTAAPAALERGAATASRSRGDDAASDAAAVTPLPRRPRLAPVEGAGDRRPVLIFGGAGFVGTNLAARLLEEGRRVLVFDNLSRAGVERNLCWLRERYGDRLQAEVADVRDRHLVREAVAQAAQVYHFAAQVAVTSSLDDPRTDFDINLGGTFNVLEAIRTAARPPPLVFTSTNKVYGALEDIALEPVGARQRPRDARLREYGVDETRPLDFHSPYGCSKGGAEQYVLDYARSYGLSAAVLRMSCIYGPHQFGNEDQGWVAHFLIRALQRQPIIVYGDGLQVRDVLFVEDLVDALLRCQGFMPKLSGHAYNMGGGPANAVSLLELLDRIGELTGERPEVSHAPGRIGDQRYYVSDTRAFAAAADWSPTVNVGEGLTRLHDWLCEEGVADGPAATRARTHAA